MSDGVKFIFKTLIKVPVIIMGSFLLINLFAFMFIYFKVLGFSYVVMQEVVENNYITTTQYQQLGSYFDELERSIPMLVDITLITGKDASDKLTLWDRAGNLDSIRVESGYGTSIEGSGAGNRSQYGKSKIVGIHCKYKFLWPLSYQFTNGGNVNGEVDIVAGNKEETLSVKDKKIMKYSAYDPTKDPYRGNINGTTPDTRMKGVIIPINIWYNIPGLKYYSDLE